MALARPADKTDRINLLNIGLMVGAAGAACAVPFELFLLAYAVLGPLHYLTQISWLHTRGYFTEGRNDYLWLGALCGGLLVLRYAVSDADVIGWATTLVCLALASALAMAFVATPWVRVACIAASLPLAHALSALDAVQIVALTFVPTIIHVYVFTAAFILHGALRGRSATGIASLVVFAACTAGVFLSPSVGGYAPGPYVRSTYELFAELNVELAAWLGFGRLPGLEAVYASETGLMLMRFIAFAYTYHYLNWFSKTSIIQWHRIPPAWTAVNLVLWVASVGLYAWDYRIGLLVLFSLSWLHVILEFPLDHRTFVGIARELGALARPARLAPARQ